MSGPNPDVSLVAGPVDGLPSGGGGIIPTSHRGLTYPLGTRAPGEGELIEIVPGVGWARIGMPGSLGHINVWLLDDADDRGPGVAIVDTGMAIDRSRASWEALFAGPLTGRRVTRVIATHFHPDHVGLAGWLCERFGVALTMTRTEWLMARLLCADRRDTPPPEALRWWRMAGYDEAQLARAVAQGWSGFASVTSDPPASFVRMSAEDRLTIGARTWRVVIGSGHTPEHACLVDEAGGVMIAGDQVLPRISSNVSLPVGEPDGDPLGDWLASIDRLMELSADLLVLPAHGEPFTGLHVRLAALRDGHHERLDALAAALDRPKTSIEVFGTLFGRAIKDDETGLAAGEAMAHLRRLELAGRARRVTEDGVARFTAI